MPITITIDTSFGPRTITVSEEMHVESGDYVQVKIEIDRTKRNKVKEVWEFDGRVITCSR